MLGVNQKKQVGGSLYDSLGTKAFLRLISLEGVGEKDQAFFVKIWTNATDAEITSGTVVLKERGAIFEMTEAHLLDLSELQASSSIFVEVREKHHIRTTFRGTSALLTDSHSPDKLHTIELKLKPREEKIDKDKKLVREGAVLYLQLQISSFPETRALTLVDEVPVNNPERCISPIQLQPSSPSQHGISSFFSAASSAPTFPAPYYDYHYHGHLPSFAPGDLIAYGAFGLIPTMTRSSSDSEVTSLGVIVSFPNKYTQEEELYIFDITQNRDSMIDAFTDRFETGATLFRLKERLHQFHGQHIWWVPLATSLNPAQIEVLRTSILAFHKNPGQCHEGLELCEGARGLIQHAKTKFSLKLKGPVYELYTPLIISKMFESVLNFPDRRSLPTIVSWPNDLVECDAWKKPVSLRELHNEDSRTPFGFMLGGSKPRSHTAPPSPILQMTASPSSEEARDSSLPTYLKPEDAKAKEEPAFFRRQYENEIKRLQTQLGEATAKFRQSEAKLKEVKSKQEDLRGMVEKLIAKKDQRIHELENQLVELQ